MSVTVTMPAGTVSATRNRPPGVSKRQPTVKARSPSIRASGDDAGTEDVVPSVRNRRARNPVRARRASAGARSTRTNTIRSAGAGLVALMVTVAVGVAPMAAISVGPRTTLPFATAALPARRPAACATAATTAQSPEFQPLEAISAGFRTTPSSPPSVTTGSRQRVKPEATISRCMAFSHRTACGRWPGRSQERPGCAAS